METQKMLGPTPRNSRALRMKQDEAEEFVFEEDTEDPDYVGPEEDYEDPDGAGPVEDVQAPSF
jgi:hypothetical protein